MSTVFIPCLTAREEGTNLRTVQLGKRLTWLEKPSGCWWKLGSSTTLKKITLISDILDVEPSLEIPVTYGTANSQFVARLVCESNSTRPDHAHEKEGSNLVIHSDSTPEEVAFLWLFSDDDIVAYCNEGPG